MRTLVIVPCGRHKIWKKNPNAGPTKAMEAYVGPPFKVNLEYAQKFAEKWVILSAKYGFIEGDFIIPENYNVTFDDPNTNPISLIRLREQVKKNLTQFNCIVALGSTTYSNIVKEAFKETGSQVRAPTAGLSFAYANGKVKNATRTNTPFVC